MPVPLLNAYTEQLPGLMAEESLMAVERGLVASGRLKRGVARQLVGAWQRQTDRPQPVLRPKTREAYDAQMGMAGIAVRRVRKADG